MRPWGMFGARILPSRGWEWIPNCGKAILFVQGAVPRLFLVISHRKNENGVSFLKPRGDRVTPEGTDPASFLSPTNGPVMVSSAFCPRVYPPRQRWRVSCFSVFRHHRSGFRKFYKNPFCTFFAATLPYFEKGTHPPARLLFKFGPPALFGCGRRLGNFENASNFFAPYFGSPGTPQPSEGGTPDPK